MLHTSPKPIQTTKSVEYYDSGRWHETSLNKFGKFLFVCFLWKSCRNEMSRGEMIEHLQNESNSHSYQLLQLTICSRVLNFILHVTLESFLTKYSHFIYSLCYELCHLNYAFLHHLSYWTGILNSVYFGIKGNFFLLYVTE